MENDSKYQMYANDLVRNVPGEYLQHLISLFMKEASVNMGCDVNEITLERVIFYVKKDFGYIPINYIASAFIKGSLGRLGDGKGRLIPKTIHNWIGEISLEYNRMVSNKIQRDKLNDVSIAMDLHKFPAGKAINKKIDWYRKGLLDVEDWDKVPLKEMAEMIGNGHDPKLTDFGIENK
jgi:hypothetical protein